jgi:hypothetical protein
MSTLNDDGQLGSEILELEWMELRCDQLRNAMLESEQCEQCCATCKKKKAPANEMELFKCGRCQVVYYTATLRARRSTGSNIKETATPSASFEV